MFFKISDIDMENLKRFKNIIDNNNKLDKLLIENNEDDGYYYLTGVDQENLFIVLFLLKFQSLDIIFVPVINENYENYSNLVEFLLSFIKKYDFIPEFLKDFHIDREFVPGGRFYIDAYKRYLQLVLIC